MSVIKDKVQFKGIFARIREWRYRNYTIFYYQGSWFFYKDITELNPYRTGTLLPTLDDLSVDVLLKFKALKVLYEKQNTCPDSSVG